MKRNLYGVFARPDHPRGWGSGERAHGYVILIVKCKSESQLDAVARALAIKGLPEPYAHRTYQWFGGQMDHVVTFKTGRPIDTGKDHGVGVRINRNASGDNRAVFLRLDAGQLLREIGSMNGPVVSRSLSAKTVWEKGKLWVPDLELDDLYRGMPKDRSDQ